jgi:ribosomal protein L32
MPLKPPADLYRIHCRPRVRYRTSRFSTRTGIKLSQGKSNKQWQGQSSVLAIAVWIRRLSGPGSNCSSLSNRRLSIVSRILRQPMRRKLRLNQGPRIFAVDTAQQSHHLLQGRNLTIDMLQLISHRPGRVKQFESNAVVICPSLQEYQHPHTATPYCVHFREVQYYDLGVCLGRNRRLVA